MHLTQSTHAAPHYAPRTRLAVVRDLVVIGVSLALIAGFLAQVWRAPPPSELHGAAAATGELCA